MQTAKSFHLLSSGLLLGADNDPWCCSSFAYTCKGQRAHCQLSCWYHFQIFCDVTCPEDLECESCLLLTGSSNLVPRASATALFLVSPPVLTCDKILTNIEWLLVIETNLFLQFREQFLMELSLSESLPLPQLLKVVSQLLLLPILTILTSSCRVLLIGNHVADVVPQLCVNKHPAGRLGSITEE